MYNAKGSTASEMTSVSGSAGKLRKKPAVLQFNIAKQLPKHTNCLSCSDDGKYLSIGHAGGLSVWCSSTLTCEAKWLQDCLEITCIHMTTTSETSYLLASIDDMGVARIFLYNLESIYLFSVINTLEDINKRNICLNFEISEGGDYGAVTMKCNSDIWLDIYYFPVEDWLRELKDPKLSANMKWSLAARVNKIIPSAATMADFSNMLTHCLVLDETNESPSYCTYHFLLKCDHCHAGCPVNVCFWWSGSYNLLYHNLSKTPKSKQDPEPQPSVLWPNAAEILCSAISRCTRFIVLGLSNSLVCVWDRLAGAPLSVCTLSTDSAFLRLQFVEYWPACADITQTLTAGEIHLMVVCKSGAFYVMNTRRGAAALTLRLSQRPEDSGDLLTVTASVAFLKGLSLVVHRNGKMFLQDVVNRATVCALIPPTSHLLATPCNPVYTLNVKQHILFMQGDKEPTLSSSSIKSNRQSQLLVLRFDEHDVIKPYVVSHLQSPWQQKTSVTGEEACKKYLQERALSMDERHKAITQTWKRLQETGAYVKT
ncbi:WD repeat-containing protein 93 isoform X2 [Dunckerocampus dactyliophorus]|uniref:WD repeat-containing protein 93 isoform X2 n=1 Tax=Dunckerocampus dactyliophorus TaxID=161453 RepID=UPI00240645AE|nr:WD repeat-containing protein 93 isoform X2 [Dunckerocampus dactyliophorus]